MNCRVAKALWFTLFFFALSALATANSTLSGSEADQHKTHHQAATVRAARQANRSAQPTPNSVFREYAASESATQGNGCGFATPCYSSIRVPEPQSLVLMGSGLLAMAGLIRRRWAR